jgi:hypothetical protein
MDPSQEYIPLPAPGMDEDRPSPSYSLSRPRQVLSFTIITLFLLTILSLGLVNQFSPVSDPGILGENESEFSPLSQSKQYFVVGTSGDILQACKQTQLCLTSPTMATNYKIYQTPISILCEITAVLL